MAPEHALQSVRRGSGTTTTITPTVMSFLQQGELLPPPSSWNKSTTTRGASRRLLLLNKGIRFIQQTTRIRPPSTITTKTRGITTRFMAP